MGSLYLAGPTIQEVDGEMMMGLSIYGVAVMDGSLYTQFYSLCIYIYICIHGQSIWSRVSSRKRAPCKRRTGWLRFNDQYNCLETSYFSSKPWLDIGSSYEAADLLMYL